MRGNYRTLPFIGVDNTGDTNKWMDRAKQYNVFRPEDPLSQVLSGYYMDHLRLTQVFFIKFYIVRCHKLCPIFGNFRNSRKIEHNL